MHFIFDTLLHTEFQCQCVLKGSGQMWPLAYHDLLSAVWPLEMKRQPWLHAYDICVNIHIQILSRSRGKLRKDEQKEEEQHFWIENKVFSGKNMTMQLTFGSREISTNSKGHLLFGMSCCFGIQTLKGGIISKKQTWITIINISIHYLPSEGLSVFHRLSHWSLRAFDYSSGFVGQRESTHQRTCCKCPQNAFLPSILLEPHKKSGRSTEVIMPALWKNSFWKPSLLNPAVCFFSPHPKCLKDSGFQYHSGCRWRLGILAFSVLLTPKHRGTVYTLVVSGRNREERGLLTSLSLCISWSLTRYQRFATLLKVFCVSPTI